MKNHILLEEGEQFNITFKHENGKKVTMSSGINPLNNNWMYWFDIENGMWATDKNGIKSIIKNIRKKSEKIYLDTFEWVK